MWMNRADTFWAACSILSLLSGFLLYVFLRPLAWMPNPGSLPEVPLFLHQQLPDALWTFSFSALLLSMGKERCSTLTALAWPLAVSWLLEALQALQIWPGTADWWDVAAATGGSVLILILLKQQKHERLTL